MHIRVEGIKLEGGDTAKENCRQCPERCGLWSPRRGNGH